MTSKLGPALNKLSDEIKNASPTGNADVDQALAQIVATGVGTAVGAVAGGTSGAFTGFNADRFNRQLHPDERTLAKHIAAKSNGRHTQEQVEDQMRIMGVAQTDGRSVPAGVAEELNGRTPTDPGARWINTGLTNANGNPLIVESLQEPNQELQGFIMANYDSAAPGHVPSNFTYAPTPAKTDVRGTVANMASGVSTAAGRFGAATAAGASIPSPFAPGLATASYVATATGMAADAVVQIAKPDVGQYWVSSGVGIAVSAASERFPGFGPAINAAANAINTSSASQSTQDLINKYWSKAIKSVNGSEKKDEKH
ncbi:hemolysin [Pandoraea cepalis]|uniref:hemolysin n=1 Tax=Pandoraea cepalis TaxID=2508294 RepID=UPI00123F16A2|nr:hemolysin [Pandoraea cepalis]